MHWYRTIINTMRCRSCSHLAGAAATVYRRAGRAMKHAIGFAACVLAAVFTVESVGIASVYRTEESVWQDTLRHNPQSRPGARD